MAFVDGGDGNIEKLRQIKINSVITGKIVNCRQLDEFLCRVFDVVNVNGQLILITTGLI